MKVIKRPIGEKDRKGNYSKWCFEINGIVIATLKKGFTGVSRGNSRLTTHYKVSYYFMWVNEALKTVFGEKIVQGSSTHSYSSSIAVTLKEVIETLNNFLEVKGLSERVI